jgi:hypothetical protein
VPQVVFTNREPYPHIVNIKEKITVVRNLSHPATVSDLSLLHNANIYEGQFHALRMFTEIRLVTERERDLTSGDFAYLCSLINTKEYKDNLLRKDNMSSS